MALAPEASVAISLLLCLVLSGLAYYRKVLTLDGTMAAFGVGILIGVFGDVTWLLLLLFFLVSSFAATRYRFALKEAMGVQEGARGERRAANVLANSAAPAAIAILSFHGFGAHQQPLVHAVHQVVPARPAGRGLPGRQRAGPVLGARHQVNAGGVGRLDVAGTLDVRVEQ
ncbi:MAG: DUF92 domain-containing protein [Candidatus Thermoplasmatota archaeon]